MIAKIYFLELNSKNSIFLNNKKTMFCQNCGKELQSEARFCSNCGTSVVAHFKPKVVILENSFISILTKHKWFILIYFTMLLLGVILHTYHWGWDIDYEEFDEIFRLQILAFNLFFFVLPLVFYLIIKIFNLKLYFNNWEIQLKRLATIAIEMLILFLLLYVVNHPEWYGYQYKLGMKKEYIVWNSLIVMSIYLVSTNFILKNNLGYLIFKLKVVSNSNLPELNLRIKVIRFSVQLIEILSMGTLFLYALFNKNGDTISDRISNTRVVKI